MHAVNWFEIPSLDFDRAVKFYSTVMGQTMEKMEFNGEPNAFFAYDREKQGIGGAVVFSQNSKPSAEGPVVYLNASSAAELEAAVNRVAGAGGAVIMPKTDLGDIGFIALIRDTEGNRVGLHAPASV